MNENSEQPIEIALAADGGYFCGLLVTACSIAKYADKSVALRFHILDGGISESDWHFLVEIVTRYHKGSSFNKILVDEVYIPSLCNNTSASIKVNDYFYQNTNNNFNDTNQYNQNFKKINNY